VFAWKGETIEEYWRCTDLALTWQNGDGPTLIIDDGSDVTLLIHEGVKAEIAYEADNKNLPNPESADSEDLKQMLTLIRNELSANPRKWRDIANRLIGVSEETTTGAMRLY
jgi:adenosylhomocysteinase